MELPGLSKAVVPWIPAVNIIRRLWRVACLHGLLPDPFNSITPLILLCFVSL